MKTGITIAIVALGLGLFAAPDAHGWWNRGPDLNLRVYGSNFITSSDDGRPTALGEVSTSMQSGIAKGRYGRAIFTAQTIIERARPNVDEPLPPSSCIAAELGGAELSTSIVLTYNDGSILSLVTGSDSIYCSDGSSFYVDFGGTVDGGEGRFEGASGSWTGSAESHPTARVTGEISIELD